MEIKVTEVVEIEVGKIIGKYTEDGAVSIYKGIPFAKPPVGPLRWQAPKKAESFEGVLECFDYSASAKHQLPDYSMPWMKPYTPDVTIVGQSAGSGSVELLCLSPKAKDLFHNAFMMSFSFLGIEPPMKQKSLSEMEALDIDSGQDLLMKKMDVQKEVFWSDYYKSL